VLAAARERGDVPVFFTTMAYEADGLDAGMWRRKVPALLGLRVHDEAAVQECVADRAPGPHHANLFDIQAKYGDVVSVAGFLKYLRKGSVEEAAE